MLAVASSTRTILVGFNMALAMLTNCLSPTLKFSPFSVIYVSRPFLSYIVSFNAHTSNAFSNSSSLYSFKGSKFYIIFILPLELSLQRDKDLVI